MVVSSSKRLVEELLALGGILIDGPNPWDIQVHDDRFYDRVLKYRQLGLGESYMDGWWDCERIDLLIARVLNAHIDKKVREDKHFWFAFLTFHVNRQSKTRAVEAVRHHYDIGNELFERMLGETLNYSCGYWKDATNLDDAQVAKMDLICRKLKLEPGMQVLDIGCGFGSLAKHAAIHYGVSVVGVTLSREQEQLAKERCRGLPIEIRLQDYRDVKGAFDRIVSVGMFEHVGHKNYKTFMQVVDRCLKSDGIFVLHTIGSMETVTHIDEWTNRYIFPDGMLPSVQQIGRAIEPFFVLEDWHSFGLHYAKTLQAWHHNFTSTWPQIKDRYSERFYRMWVYYLLSSAGGFLAKSNQLWQLVLTKPSRTQEYLSER